MRHRKHRKGGRSPSFVDPEFADSLEAGGGSTRRSRHGDHKAEQLCRQAQEALNLALADLGEDPFLTDLFVAQVTPAPAGGRLVVHVAVPPGRTVAEVLARLREVAPHLRAEVAAAITRKRAPELSFLPFAAGGDHE